MKILLVTGPFISLREPFSGSTESFVVDHANELVRLGHTVNVIAKDTDERNSFQVIEFHESPLSMKDNSYRACSELLGQQHYQTLQFGMLDVTSYDIVHYNSFIPEIYGVGALLKLPAVLTLHLPPTEKLALMYRFFAKHAQVVPVAISAGMSEQWQPNFEQEVPMIPNGIPTRKWKSNPRKINGYLLWSGRIEKEGNVEAAINLARYLKRPLKIIGQIFKKSYFDTYVGPYLNENIEYVPLTTKRQLSEMAAGASLYLATASSEGPFHLRLIEMLASGLPIVGFNTAIPLELRHNDIAPSVDSSNWKDLIGLVDIAKSIRPESCRDFATLFDINKMSASYLRLYEYIVKANGL